jgi:hypothetical protein
MTRDLTGRSGRSFGAALAIAAVLLLAVLEAPATSATTTIGFTPTGSMTIARDGATAGPLADGKVLVVGGGTSPSSAEIFDPATNIFSSAGIGATTSPRVGAAAAPLPDGRVLIAGGGPPASAEVFNPATKTFSAVGPMTMERLDPAAAPLPDGRVLVVGGSNGVTYTNTAEIFDPKTNSFSSAGVGNMTDGRYAPIAAPLPDGRVLVAGGNSVSAPAYLKTAEVFNPASKTFSSAGIGSMSTGRFAAGAAPLPDGRVLVAGGLVPGSGAVASAEVFNPSTNTFSSAGIGSMTIPREAFGMAPTGDGRVLAAGGDNSATPNIQSAEVFAVPNTFTTKVKGKKLIVTVSTPGTVQVQAAAGKAKSAAAIAAKKHKKKLPLKASTASGGPGRIVVKLKLANTAKATFKRTGKVEVRAAVTFTPAAGFARTKTLKLKLKSKRH